MLNSMFYLAYLCGITKMNAKQLFSHTLRQAVEKRYGTKRITSSQFANAYNLITNTPITQETARKWMTGKGLPRYERLFELIHWLKIDPSDLFKITKDFYQTKHDVLSQKRGSSLNLEEIKELSRDIGRNINE